MGDLLESLEALFEKSGFVVAQSSEVANKSQWLRPFCSAARIVCAL